MKSIIGIKTGIQNKEADNVIARKLFLSYSTEVFKDNEDAEFYIKNRISTNFNIPFSSVEIAGSSKTGLSFIKCTKFTPKISDLDIAIISMPLFIKYCEIAHKTTKGYTDLTSFPVINGQNTLKQFRNGISSNGFLNPFIMPNCNHKYDWLQFFNSLSNTYHHLFKNINAAIYASEYFFESKQEKCIQNYHGNTKEYDKISSTV